MTTRDPISRVEAALEGAERPRVEWLRALKALRRLARGNDYPKEVIREYTAALDGGQQEDRFRQFLAEPGAEQLLAERPDLAARLDDWDALGALPEGSLGRAYLDLARRDGIRAADLSGEIAEVPRGPGAADPRFHWFSARGPAGHDLLHVLTGYGRDPAGETALLAFTLGQSRARVLKVSLFLGLLAAPKRRYPQLLRYILRAHRRGCRARIPLTTRWEELLPLPIEEVRRRLHIDPTAAVHPEGVWQSLGDPGPWAPAGA